MTLHPGDFDADGDVDWLRASGWDNRITFFENPGDGSVATSSDHVAILGYPSSLDSADLDGNGSLDVIAASAPTDRIVWYRNRADGVGDICDHCPFDATNLDYDDDGFCDDGDGSGSPHDQPCAPGASPGEACDDSCADVSNPDQGSAPFGQIVRGTGAAQFAWTSSLGWERSGGSFAAGGDLDGYPVTFTATGSGTGEEILGSPPPGTGWWYLWRPVCAVGSYSTGSPSEVGDRSVLLP